MLLSAHTPDKVEAGCDEAGRGCLAGPVVAAAVIFPKDYSHPQLNDSKQLKREDREVFRYIIQRDALAWAVAEVSPQEIDKINILKASFLAMHRALVQLKIRPELLLIDGNRFVPYGETPHECIIKGDGKYLSIAAASILAKTHRDEVMERFAADYPQYGWHQNVGYPTPAHRKAIAEHGTTPHHRMSFKLLPDQLELFEKEEKKS